MNIFILCNSDILAANTIHYLWQGKQLAGIGIIEKYAAHLMGVFHSIGVEKSLIHVFQKKEFEHQLAQAVVASNADCMLTLTFPWKIPTTILALPAKGCINFHFGLLPKYRGADPIFWQLKNREANGGITVHYMNDQIDKGDIIHTAETPIMLGETYGIHSVRLASLASELTANLPALLRLSQQPQRGVSPSNFFQAPTQEALTIHWQTQTADDIVALVNASNPKYHGAVTHIKQQPVRILEAAMVEVNTTEQFLPGTIVLADQQYGLIVACLHNKFINIQVVHVKEGYLSGIKLFQLGLTIGDSFN